MHRVFLMAILALLPAGIVAAEHSTPACPTPYRTVSAGGATFYVIHDLNETWIYMESNGHPDLQRGGRAWYDFGIDHEWRGCWDMVTGTSEYVDPDFIVL